LAPVREDRATAVLLVVEMPTLIRPPVVTPDVRFTDVHEFATIAPELPSLVLPKGGAFESVIVVSPQVLSATGNTS
jgi:hypothetical protein